MISVFNKFILGAFFIITFCACGNFLEEVSQDEFEPETTDAYSELLNGACICRIGWFDLVYG